MSERLHLTNRKARARGIALLITLLLITLMSSVAIAVTDDIRFAIRRTSNISVKQQSYWYAQGAETLARQVLLKGWKADPSRTTLRDPWAMLGVAFPIDGGSITGNIVDGGNCFNLNSVVERGAKGTYVESDSGQRFFLSLLEALEIPPEVAQSLAAGLVDWIDSDDVPGHHGAEDYTYSSSLIPYRTGATLLAEPSELRAIAGYSEEIYRRIRPHVCALPTIYPSRFNINTMTGADAVLLVMLTGGELRLAEAGRLINDRPVSGYARKDDFLANDLFTGIELSTEARSLLDVRTRYFSVDIKVDFHQARFAMTSLLEISDNGTATTYARRFGGMD